MLGFTVSQLVGLAGIVLMSTAVGFLQGWRNGHSIARTTKLAVHDVRPIARDVTDLHSSESLIQYEALCYNNDHASRCRAMRSILQADRDFVHRMGYRL